MTPVTATTWVTEIFFYSSDPHDPTKIRQQHSFSSGNYFSMTGTTESNQMTQILSHNTVYKAQL